MHQLLIEERTVCSKCVLKEKYFYLVIACYSKSGPDFILMCQDSHRGGPGLHPGSRGVHGGQSGTGAGFRLLLRFPLPVIIPPISTSS
jgi:hypothetical protein